MELISGLMPQQKTQSAEEIIPTLCDRLAHAKLATDKRAAILTLKGFAREYRELVIANGLRGLIATLREYSEEPDISRACLETILVLFIRGEGDEDQTRAMISQQSRTQNGKYPSPLLMKQENQGSTTDQFSMWIADEIIQTEGNITVIISLLGIHSENFHIKLYTLQLLEALVSIRPEKAKDSFLNSPLGVPSIIEAIDDYNDAVRNEAILLLMAIANDNFNIQKLVAFEGTFEKLFKIIDDEGDIRGSIVVQDCLTLLSNLLKYNVSNQKLFFETNCLRNLAYLISRPLDEEGIVWNDQRLQNVMTVLEIVNLFVIQGNESTKANQDAIRDAQIFLNVLRLAFSSNTPNSMRPAALRTVSVIIANNEEAQQEFSGIDVPYIDPSLPTQLQRFKDPVPVVIALLNWCLYVNSVHVFDIRVAAAELIRASFEGNDLIKTAFVQDQIADYYDEHQPEEDTEEQISVTGEEPTTNGSAPEPETPIRAGAEWSNVSTPPTNGTIASLEMKETPIANIFQALLEYDPELKLNPYKIWFSSVILISLIHEDDNIKSLVRGVHAGDEEAGEDVISAIQAMSGLLITSLTTQDQRVSIGYLMLLIVMLFEDFDSVNDFLGDSSNIKSLLQYLALPSSESGIVQGLTTILVGIAFEFSNKESPLSRVDLHALIVKMVGKDSYGFKILQFKENTFFSNYNEEDAINPSRDETGLPQVFFDSTVISLIKENYYRFKNTLNQDPTLESNGRISYEKFEELQEDYLGLQKTYNDYQEKSEILQKEINETLEKTTIELNEANESYKNAGSELSELKRQHRDLETQFTETSAALVALQKLHDELSTSSTKNEKDLQSTSEQLISRDTLISNLRKELKQLQEQKKKAEDDVGKMSRDLFKLSTRKEELEKQVKKLDKDVQNNIKQQEKLQDSLKQKTEEVADLKTKLKESQGNLKNTESSRATIERELNDAKSKNTQNETLIEQLTEKLRSIALSCQELTAGKAVLEEEIASLKVTSAKELEDLKSHISQLEASNNDLQLLSDGLSSQKEKLQNSILATNELHATTLSELESEKHDLKKSITGLKAELEASKQLCGKNEAQIRYLDAQVKATKDELNGLKEAHGIAVQESADSHNKALVAIQKELSTQKQVHKSTVTDLKSKIKDLTSIKETSTRELDTHKKDLNIIKKQLDEKHTKLTNLSDELDEKHTLVEELRAAKDSLESELLDSSKDSKRKIGELQYQVDQLTKTKSRLETELDDLALEYEGKESETKKEIKTLLEKIKSVEEEKKSLTSTLEMISQRIETKDMESESLSKSLKTKISDIEEMTKEKERLEKEKEKLGESLESSRKQCEVLEADIVALKEKLDESSNTLEKSESSLKSLQQRTDDQKKKNAKKVSALEKEIKTLKESIEKKTGEFEKERMLLSQNSSSTTKEYSEKVTKLEEQIQKLETSTDEKTSALEREKINLEETIADLKSANENLVSDVKSKDTKISELKKSIKDLDARTKSLQKKSTEMEKELSVASGLQNKLDVETEKLSTATLELDAKKNALKESEKKVESSLGVIEKLERDTVRLQTELETEAASHESLKLTLDENVKKLESALSDLQDRNEKLNETLKNKTAESDTELVKYKSECAELSGKANALEANVKSLTVSLEEAISTKESVGSELSTLKETSEKSIKSLQSELAEFKSCSQDNEKLLKEKEHLEAQNSELSQRLDDNTKASAGFESLTKENDDLKKQIENLKKTMVNKSELDDLMLVLDDLDEKKKKYKAQAKTLGGDVSSDEEEEDDEDDDDEDDEEDGDED